MENKNDGIRAALEWYAEKAEEMQRHALRHDTKAMMAVMHVLSVDGGARARHAPSGEYICPKCWLRQDAQREPPTF